MTFPARKETPDQRWTGHLDYRRAASARLLPSGEFLADSMFLGPLDFTIALRRFFAQPERPPLVYLEMWQIYERDATLRTVYGIWDCQVIGVDRPKRTDRPLSRDRIWIGTTELITWLREWDHKIVVMQLWDIPLPLPARRETLWEGI